MHRLQSSGLRASDGYSETIPSCKESVDFSKLGSQIALVTAMLGFPQLR